MTSLSEHEIEARYAFARALAQSAGERALQLQRDDAAISVANKGLQDFVTNADRECEALIRAAIARDFPDDGFVGEETGRTGGDGPVWVIDPIDGTNNYMRRLPDWGVSIALVADGEIMLGAIFDATTQTVFHARRGHGAFNGDNRLAASTINDPQAALALTGHSRRTAIGPYLDLLLKLHEQGFDHRRIGAAALGLLRVAEGKAELYYEAHLNCWDVLAGILIAEEAGAVVERPALADLLRQGGPVRACGPEIASAVSELFQPLAERRQPRRGQA
ncbi:inositol monophosphatase family protein [Martelella sp. AMO21009]